MTHPRLILLLLVLALVSSACGARTELDLDVPSGSNGGAPPGECEPEDAPTPCARWVVGVPQIVGPSAPPNTYMEIADVTPIECGVLAAWYTLDTSASADSLEWFTRAIAADGSPLSTVQAHEGLSAMTNASAALSMVARDGVVGGVEFDETGCRFVAMDVAGVELAPPSDLGAAWCTDIAGGPERWSFLRTEAGAVSPVSLAWFDVTTKTSSSVTLSTPPDQVVWDRVVFDDGSFLVASFAEDPVTTVYTDYLQAFGSDGTALAANTPVEGFASAPIWLAPTSMGAIAAWSDGGVVLAPVDRLGQPTGPRQTIAPGATIYEVSLLPTPDGDVLLAWMELQENSALRLSVIALDPLGVPRGPAAEIGERPTAVRLRGAVPTPSRALLIETSEDGVRALPLECAT